MRAGAAPGVKQVRVNPVGLSASHAPARPPFVSMSYYIREKYHLAFRFRVCSLICTLDALRGGFTATERRRRPAKARKQAPSRATAKATAKKRRARQEEEPEEEEEEMAESTLAPSAMDVQLSMI